jgi:uncharacterized membrane protein
MEQVTLGAAIRRANSTLLRTGIILGIGVVGSLDEIILHQLLQWHNFYVHTTQFWRLVSDGLFHLLSATLLFVGALRLWSQRELIRRGHGRALASGILFGMGGFNLYDGIVQHKVLQLHPVREKVANILPYDLAFNAVALVLLAIAWLLWGRVRSDQLAPSLSDRRGVVGVESS